MTWQKSHKFAVAVETAYKMGIRPTSLLTDTDPSDPWSSADKKLVMAFTILNRETCSKCGNPVWICRSSNRNLLFKAKKDICYASLEYEKYSESKAGKNLKRGEYIFVEPYMANDEPLPSRQAYFESLAED